MKSKFTTELSCKEDSAQDGRWILLADLCYESEYLDDLIVVPAGFETDFASVPRVPIIYMLYGDRAHRESVLHDWLYYTAKMSRKVADRIFLEAMDSRGKSRTVKMGMYLGVRAGGWVAWRNHRKLGHPL